jgi:hypothetical protein
MIPWCTSHYRHEYCLEKAKELRKSGKYKKVRVGYTVVVNGQKYSKIYIES